MIGKVRGGERRVIIKGGGRGIIRFSSGVGKGGEGGRRRMVCRRD